MDNLTPHAKHTLDLLAYTLAGVSMATAQIINFLPAAAAFLSIIWSLLRFSEMLKARKYRRRIGDKAEKRDMEEL